ncbi:MAG: hypothetical protein HYW28_07240 [Rhodospirillales bacterium]|nr:hypothetical protein [Rhodospirillales bacterium]
MVRGEPNQVLGVRRFHASGAACESAGGRPTLGDGFRRVASEDGGFAEAAPAVAVLGHRQDGVERRHLAKRQVIGTMQRQFEAV